MSCIHVQVIGFIAHFRTLLLEDSHVSSVSFLVPLAPQPKHFFVVVGEFMPAILQDAIDLFLQVGECV